jgi:hypothetical protein
MKTLINKKRIGEKVYIQENMNLDYTKYKIVSIPQYKTSGEEIILVKNINSSKISLDPHFSKHIKIKAMTKVLIVPLIGKIDDEYDEILIDKGACVEFQFIENGWYIMSSDGLKIE